MLDASWVFKKKNIPYEEGEYFFIVLETKVPKNKNDKTEAFRQVVSKAEETTGQSGLKVLDYSLESKPTVGMLVAVGKELSKKEEKIVEIKSSKRFSLGKLLKFQEKMKEK